jgi:hypothetical protein
MTPSTAVPLHLMAPAPDGANLLAAPLPVLRLTG